MARLCMDSRFFSSNCTIQKLLAEQLVAVQQVLAFNQAISTRLVEENRTPRRSNVGEGFVRNSNGKGYTPPHRHRELPTRISEGNRSLDGKCKNNIAERSGSKENITRREEQAKCQTDPPKRRSDSHEPPRSPNIRSRGTLGARVASGSGRTNTDERCDSRVAPSTMSSPRSLLELAEPLLSTDQAPCPTTTARSAHHSANNDMTFAIQSCGDKLTVESDMALVISSFSNHNGETEDEESEMFGHRRTLNVPGTVVEDKSGEILEVQTSIKEVSQRVAKLLAEPQKGVEELYHEQGLAQLLARHYRFQNATCVVIGFNMIWLAVDTDCNHADVLSEAPLVFQIISNLFTIYFLLEIVIRFLAFKHKFDAFQEKWFCFDLFLVLLMIWETWVQVLLFKLEDSASDGYEKQDVAVLRALRVIRLFRAARVARMTRLLRSLPELMVLITGMMIAIRSVFSTLALLGLLIYVFSIVFRLLLEDEEAVAGSFDSVLGAMQFLLLQVLCGFDAQFVMKMGSVGWVYYVLFLMYLFLASSTLMNMLTAVLCDVVSNVSSEQKQGVFQRQVQVKVGAMLASIDADGSGTVSKDELVKMACDPAMARSLHSLGVDVCTLVEFLPFIFHGDEEMPVNDFLEIVAQFGGANNAIYSFMRRFVLVELARLEAKL